MAIDYDHELNNGWNQWQNLVLQGMKEHKDLMEKQGVALEDIKIAAAVSTAKAEQAAKEVASVMQIQQQQAKEIVELKSFRDKALGVVALMMALLIPALIPTLTTMFGALTT